MKAEYLLFNVLIITSLLLAKLLYKKARFPEFKTALKAILPIALFFILVDAFVTNWFWWFNPQFTLGIKLGPLPIEEILFFFTVPFACLFLWVNIKERLIFRHSEFISGSFIVSIVVILIFISFLFLIQFKYYTSYAIVLLAFPLLFDFLFKTYLFFDKRFILFMGVVLIFTLVFNGYLTGRPIVLYYPSVNVGINVFTIPIEDFFYGFSLVASVCILYEYIQTSRNASF